MEAWYSILGVVLEDSRKLSIVFSIDGFGKSIDSFDGIIDSFYIKNANVNAPPHKKKWFFVIFSENDTIFKKIAI